MLYCHVKHMTFNYSYPPQGRMYEDPKRWGYLFQSHVLMSMMELHHKEVVSNTPPHTHTNVLGLDYN